jgi:hypothetical protein
MPGRQIPSVTNAEHKKKDQAETMQLRAVERRH